MSSEEIAFGGGGPQSPRLSGYLSRPVTQVAARGRRVGLVVAHGFPSKRGGAPRAAARYPALADRLSTETGAVVLTFNFRGTGTSDGDFSLAGWLADLRSAIARLREVDEVTGVWLIGMSTGGSLSICAAAEDTEVRGVATLSATADFHGWASDPRRFLDHARDVGVIRDQGFPSDFHAWARELREIRPLDVVRKIPPRPLLILHGSADLVVPSDDARALADAAEGEAELRILPNAGHRIRHDPRAIATLLGWIDRQEP